VDIVKQFLAIVNLPSLYALIALICIDWLAGVVVAIKTKAFKWSYLANFIRTDVLYQVGGYILMAMVGAAAPAIYSVTVISWAAIDASLLADIISKVQAMGATPAPPAPPATPIPPSK
jgi:hypothetical protein